jgi:hypothetical protein
MDKETKMGPEAAATAIRTPTAPLKTDSAPLPQNERRCQRVFVRAGGASRPSLRSAIDAMCKNCLYDPGNGNGGWREQIQGCSSSNCALHPVRPLPVKARKQDEDAHKLLLGPAAPNERGYALSGAKVGHNDLTPGIGRAA